MAIKYNKIKIGVIKNQPVEWGFSPSTKYNLFAAFPHQTFLSLLQSVLHGYWNSFWRWWVHYVVDVVETLGQHEEAPASTEQPVDGEPGEVVLHAIHIHQHSVHTRQAGRHDCQPEHNTDDFFHCWFYVWYLHKVYDDDEEVVGQLLPECRLVPPFVLFFFLYFPKHYKEIKVVKW